MKKLQAVRCTVNRMIRLWLLAVSLGAGQAGAEGIQSLDVLSPPLKAAVSDTNAVPFAIFSAGGQLSGGMAKDILDLVAQELRSPVQYLDIPRARLEPWLVSGDAEVGCFLNPDWVNQPKRFDWTDTLFFSRQLIIRRGDSAPIRRLSDLYYKRVGTTFGFIYPELQQAFNERLIMRDDAKSLQSNLKRLAQRRLDAVMAVDLSYFYLMERQQFDTEFVAEPIWSEPPGVFCAVSQQSPRRQAILRAFSRLKAQGIMEQLILKYKGADPT
jgi:polar amino acid transport system substrate-binding protein